MKTLQLERENIGIELYGVQQQLAKQQMLVEAEQDRHTVTSQLRAQKDTTLNQIREFYRNLIQQLKNERQQSKYTSSIILPISLIMLVLGNDSTSEGPSYYKYNSSYNLLCYR